MLKTIDGGKTHQVREGIAPRRSPRPVDRSEEPEADDLANDGGVDISSNGGETWYAPPLPISQFYHVSVDNRAPVPRRRRDAGPRHRAGAEQTASAAASRSPTGTASAAARPATSSPTRATRTSSMPASISGIITRYDHRTGEVAQRQRLAGESVGPRRRGHEVPVPVDGADRHLAARSQGRLSRRAGHLPHRRRRPELGRDQPGSDAQRQVEAEVVGRADHRRQHRRRDLRHRLRDRGVAEDRRASSGPAATTGSCTSRATTARTGRTSRRRCPASPSGARSA